MADGSQQQALTAVVTGAAGFIGFHVVQALLGAGARVTGVDSLNDYYDVALKKARLAVIDHDAAGRDRFEFVHAEIGKGGGFSDLIERVRPDIVIHLAAQAGVRYSLINPQSYTAANIDGFLAVLEAVRRTPVRHLIYASSSSVYGRNTKVPFHEDDPVSAPSSLYAATKRANELMAEVYAHLYAIPCSGLRFFTVYGPWGRPDMAYYSFAEAITRGDTIEVYNNGRLRRDFTYVDDVVEAIIRLIDHPPTGSGRSPHTIYNVGNNTPVDLEQFIATLEAKLGKSAVKRYVPMQPGDVVETYADVARLASVTGYAPKTSLETGLGHFTRWYRAYHKA